MPQESRTESGRGLSRSQPEAKTRPLDTPRPFPQPGAGPVAFTAGGKDTPLSSDGAWPVALAVGGKTRPLFHSPLRGVAYRFREGKPRPFPAARGWMWPIAFAAGGIATPPPLPQPAAGRGLSLSQPAESHAPCRDGAGPIAFAAGGESHAPNHAPFPQPAAARVPLRLRRAKGAGPSARARGRERGRSCGAGLRAAGAGPGRGRGDRAGGRAGARGCGPGAGGRQEADAAGKRPGEMLETLRERLLSVQQDFTSGWVDGEGGTARGARCGSASFGGTEVSNELGARAATV